MWGPAEIELYGDEVFNENADYGFRRNSLGIRPFGLAIAAASFLLSLGLSLTSDDPVSWIITAGVSAVLAVYWWRVVTDEWVRDAAEAYADRMMEALETLSEG